MKKIILPLIVLTVLLLCHQNLEAQSTQKPSFTYNFDGTIDFMKLTDSGILVVANGDGFAGIKPGQDQLHFNFTDYGKVKEEELQFIPLSPYVIVSQGGLLSSKKSVIDFVAGKKLFATEDNGWKMTYTCDVVLPQNKLIISGQRRASEQYAMAVAVYDLVSGKEEKLFKLKGATTMVTGVPLMVGDGIIVPTSKALMHIDTKSGAVTWEAKVDNITWMTADATGKEIYAFEEKPGGDTKIHKVSQGGQILWKEEQKVKGKVSNFQILPEGLAVVSDVIPTGNSTVFSAASESKIALMSTENGEDLWEKAPKTKGYVQHFYVMDDGILFGIREGGINKISFDGKTLFKKPLKTGENIHTMAMTPKGMIYITDTDADIISLTTGESIWSKPIKYKKAKSVCSTYDSRNKRYLISTGEEMLAIDEITGEISTLAKFEFKENESPTSLAIREGGLLLSSDQNMMLLNFDGSNKFHAYYKSPSRSTFGKIMGGIMAVASTTMMVMESARAGANKNAIGQYNDVGREAQRNAEFMAAISSASFAYISKRFKASSATKDAQFILTKLDDGVGLVSLNKDSGKVEKEIILKDKKPEYIVDDFGGLLYYQASGSSIQAFDLKN